MKSKLDVFINEVEAMVRSGRMSAENGERLIQDARRIIQSPIR